MLSPRCRRGDSQGAQAAEGRLCMEYGGRSAPSKARMHGGLGPGEGMSLGQQLFACLSG